MTDNAVAAPEADFDLKLLDPGSWEEPKEIVPVKVIRSRFRWSSPEYNKATSFRQAFPYRGAGKGPNGDSIQQWDFQLERFDAKYKLPDGTFAPVIIYAGVDLEKMDNKTGVLKGIAKTRGKEQFIISAWTKLVGSLVPDPSKLEGLMFNVERYREKEIAPGFFAKNVVVPVEALPPTFVYSGDVQFFDAKREATDAGVNGAASTIVSAVSKEDAAKAIASFLAAQGIDKAKADVSVLGHPDFPQDARIEPFLTAIATGNLAATLGTFGA